MAVPPRSGPARFLKPYADTSAAIALATSAAYAADRVRDVPAPPGDAMRWVCFTALAFGFGWAAYTLLRPRR